MWAGVQKGGPGSPMVCGACPDWERCAGADRCARASDGDYARSVVAREVSPRRGMDVPDAPGGPSSDFPGCVS
jgi:hypothetical protein